MKTAATIIGAIVFFLLAIGTLFKTMHWPGANIALILGAGSIWIYLVFAAATRTGKSSGIEMASLIFGVLGGTLLSNGMLFKIMHWPGGNVMLLGGMVFTFFVFFPIYLIGLKKNSSGYGLNLITVLTLGIFGMLMMAYNTRGASRILVQGYGRVAGAARTSGSTALAALQPYYSLIEQMQLQDPGGFRKYDRAKALQKRSMEVREYIHELRLDLLRESSGWDTDSIPDYTSLPSLDDPMLPTYYMTGDDPSSEDCKASKLQKKLASYKLDILTLPAAKVEIGLNTNDIETESEGLQKWQEYYFYNVSLGEALTTLARLENDVTNAELIILGQLILESKSNYAENQSK